MWNSQNCSMFPLAFVAGWLQGHWWGFISRNYVVWPTFLLMNVFIALKGSHFWCLFLAMRLIFCSHQTTIFSFLHTYIWAASWQNQQNGMCAQWKLGSAWASPQSDQSSLSAWRKLGSLATHWVHSEDSDQTGRMPRLIWVFTGHTGHFVGFVMRRLIWA